MYQKPTAWTGRIDGRTPEFWRWHQAIKLQEIGFFQDQEELPNFVALLGFCSDEGVRRNQGRTGAKDAPNIIRTFCANFPVHETLNLVDVGNIICQANDLEGSQQELAMVVAKLQQKSLKTIILGGGHEVMYGHYSGLRLVYADKKIGIINFDAHFDNRAVDVNIGATSGTGFWQIAQEYPDFCCLAIGIQKNSNTKVLFETAHRNNTTYILAEDFTTENKGHMLEQINAFIEEVDIVYLTVCLDVFSVAFAPAVSAPASIGILPDAIFLQIFRTICSNTKIQAFDVAELNPTYDIDNRTARLAAVLVYEFVTSRDRGN